MKKQSVKKNESKQKPSRQKAKKGYTTPQLTTYGNVEQITKRASYVGGDMYKGNALY